MKHTKHPLMALLATLAFSPGLCPAQQALKTDNAGNPITPLNLGGGNVTGTLAAARLPAGIGVPVVQTIAQAEGSVTVAAGTNVAVLATPLTGTLNLRLPAANSYPAGRVLVVVDPGGYSNADQPVQVQPAGSDLLNGSDGSAGAVTVLTGIGAASLSPDGTSRWATGQSYLRAPKASGLTLAGPGTTSDATALSVHDGNEQEIFFVRGDGTASAPYLAAANAMSSDSDLIYSDGTGGLIVDNLSATFSASNFVEFRTVVPSLVSNPSNAARLYYAADGALHVRTPDHVDHILTWTTAP